MEYASGLIKVKAGSEAKVEEWRSTTASRLDEAAATLKDEDVQVESWSACGSHDGFYCGNEFGIATGHNCFIEPRCDVSVHDLFNGSEILTQRRRSMLWAVGH